MAEFLAEHNDRISLLTRVRDAWYLLHRHFISVCTPTDTTNARPTVTMADEMGVQLIADFHPPFCTFNPTVVNLHIMTLSYLWSYESWSNMANQNTRLACPISLPGPRQVAHIWHVARSHRRRLGRDMLDITSFEPFLG